MFRMTSAVAEHSISVLFLIYLQEHPNSSILATIQYLCLPKQMYLLLLSHFQMVQIPLRWRREDPIWNKFYTIRNRQMPEIRFWFTNDNYHVVSELNINININLIKKSITHSFNIILPNSHHFFCADMIYHWNGHNYI